MIGPIARRSASWPGVRSRSALPGNSRAFLGPPAFCGISAFCFAPFRQMLSFNGAERAMREAGGYVVPNLRSAICRRRTRCRGVPVGGDAVGGGDARLSAGARAAVDRSVGLKLYAPWKLFAWWLAFDAQAPDVFAPRRRRRRPRRRRQRRTSPSGEPPGGPAASNQPPPTARPAGRTFADVREAGLLGDARRRPRPLSATAICATTVPSTCWRWRRPGPARASAWCCPRC